MQMMTDEKLDKEWILLITKAKQMGLTPDEIRLFLRKPSLENNASHESES